MMLHRPSLHSSVPALRMLSKTEPSNATQKTYAVVEAYVARTGVRNRYGLTGGSRLCRVEAKEGCCFRWMSVDRSDDWGLPREGKRVSTCASRARSRTSVMLLLMECFRPVSGGS